MNEHILNTDVQKFITENLNADISKLLLKGVSFKNVSTLELIEQIEAKRKCKSKLPTWFASENIYYPNKLNIEQTSSERAAFYKTEILKGESIIDLTGGFGVDTFFFSKCFDTILHCEINKELSKIANHNFTQLGKSHIQTIAEDGIEVLKKLDKHFDWIYVDPSRRHDSKGKVFFLNDCTPNIPLHLDEIFNYTKSIAIKTSPLLDLTVGINELKFVKTIHIIAINNEVKELLWILEKNYAAEIKINTVNLLSKSVEEFDFILNEEANTSVKYSKPLKYLYEPNSAILKSGAYKTVAKKMGITKLHQHSHLYTSDVVINFPGRQFKIENVITYNKKSLKRLGIVKANITTRNFPESVEQLRKKTNIKDGGTVYLFFTTDLDNTKIVIICQKIMD